MVVGRNFHTLAEALEQKIDWVIGGASIYEQTINLCSEIHISRIEHDGFGDTKFEIPSDYQGKIFEYFFKPTLI